MLPPPPPADEIARRIAAFQLGLQRDGLDGALVVQSADLVYLSGTAQNAHLIVPATGEPLLLVRRDLERARSESALERIEPFTSLRALPAAFASAGLGERMRLGLELDVLPAASYLRYRELLPGAEPADCMPALWSARSRKSEWELARIRLACEQTKAAMEYAPQLLLPGSAECDVLSQLGHHMRLRGHEGTIRFRGINSEFLYGQVLAGESAPVPGPTETPLHGPGLSTAQGRGPSRRPLRDGDAVVIDISGLAEGYVSDQTRTFFIGHADPMLLAAYETCRQILAECVALLRPGTPGSALYERALEVAADAGHAEHFMGAGDGRVRFVGHCIGLELNEPPYLARGYAQPLETRNVVAIEPKLAFTGLGAVGVENSYFLGEDGPVQLTGATEEAVIV
ncbi:MAG TPA: Xaa-Pro peptidase family protein [Gaiellales bacterium]|nr:Xaa-Pro peptidase family protein [Gaiellales bacterium]